MKTSERLLIFLAGFIIALLVVGLLVLRQDLADIHDQEIAIVYEPVPVNKFDQVSFAGNWSVKIRQGNEYRIEVSKPEELLHSTVEIDGTAVYFNHNVDSGTTNQVQYAKVITPYLQRIEGNGHTQINMKSVTLDSIRVVLTDSCSLIGINTKFTYSNFQTTGKASLEFIEHTKNIDR